MEPSIIMGQSYTLDSGEVAVDGDLALVDSASGNAVAGQVGTGLVLLGTFDIGQQYTVTGDGTKKVRIKFFQPGQVAPCTATGTAPKAGSTVYVSGPSSVTADSTGASVAGVVVKVDGSTFYVRPAV